MASSVRAQRRLVTEGEPIGEVERGDPVAPPRKTRRSARGRQVVDRGRWIAEGLEVLAAEGLAAVRVELLAKRLKVTKGSFYWHFKDRQDLLDAMLDEWRRSTLTAVVESIWGRPVDAKQKLQRLWRICHSGRMDNPGGQLEAGLRQWSLAEPSVAELIAAVDLERVRFVAQIYAELGAADPEAYARLFYHTVVGNNTVSLRSKAAREQTDPVMLRALLIEA